MQKKQQNDLTGDAGFWAHTAIHFHFAEESFRTAHSEKRLTFFFFGSQTPELMWKFIAKTRKFVQTTGGAEIFKMLRLTCQVETDGSFAACSSLLIWNVLYLKGNLFSVQSPLGTWWVVAIQVVLLTALLAHSQMDTTDAVRCEMVCATLSRKMCNSHSGDNAQSARSWRGDELRVRTTACNPPPVTCFRRLREVGCVLSATSININSVLRNLSSHVPHKQYLSKLVL